jgi:hypothetical protein
MAVLFRSKNGQAHGSSLAIASSNPSSHAFKSASIKIAGTLLFLAACAALAATTHTGTALNSNKSAVTTTSTSTPSHLTVTQDSQTSSEQPADATTSTTEPAATSVSATTDGTTSQVTVNGQDVAVPDNGTVTGNVDSTAGNTSFSINTSNAGGTTNHSMLHMTSNTNSTTAGITTTIINGKPIQ